MKAIDLRLATGAVQAASKVLVRLASATGCLGLSELERNTGYHASELAKAAGVLARASALLKSRDRWFKRWQAAYPDREVVQCARDDARLLFDKLLVRQKDLDECRRERAASADQIVQLNTMLDTLRADRNALVDEAKRTAGPEGDAVDSTGTLHRVEGGPRYYRTDEARAESDTLRRNLTCTQAHAAALVEELERTKAERDEARAESDMLRQNLAYTQEHDTALVEEPERMQAERDEARQALQELRSAYTATDTRANTFQGEARVLRARAIKAEKERDELRLALEHARACQAQEQARADKTADSWRETLEDRDYQRKVVLEQAKDLGELKARIAELVHWNNKVEAELGREHERAVVAENERGIERARAFKAEKEAQSLRDAVAGLGRGP